MSFEGYQRLTTPHLDGFARDAVVYRDAHSVSPWTLPSHVSMFTGLLPSQHGATWRPFGTPEDASLQTILSRSIASGTTDALLPQRLRERGYYTLGLSNNAWVSRRTGFDRGFDAFYELWRERDAVAKSSGGLAPELRMPAGAEGGDAGRTLLRFHQHVESNGLPEPFFAFFNFIDPHYPYSPPPAWRYLYSDDVDLGERIARFQFSEMAMVAGDLPPEVDGFAAFYDAELRYLDFVLGRLLTWLRANGYYDETLIVLTSDHGEHLGEAGRFSHQFSMEEELLRIPLVIRYPGGAQSGTLVQNPTVSNLDVFRTILAAAGVPSGAPSPAPSRDLRRMDRFDRPYLIAEYHHSLPYLRAHREAFAGFPVDRHRVTRRVLFDQRERHVFVDTDELTDASASPARAQAAAFLQAFLATVEGGVVRDTGQPVDAETLERLRSLGYAR